MAECSYRRAQLREKLECSFPIDDLLSKMYAANVLTFYEFEEIKSTPNFVKRNSTFFDYLGRKEAMAIHLTLGILSKSEYVTYHYLGEMLRELFGVRGTEYEGGAPNASQPMRGASTIVESSKSLRTKLGRYYSKECIQDNPLLASSTMQYVRLNLVQPYQRRPVTGRADETVAVQMARGGAEQGPLKKIAIKYEKILSFSPPTGISRKRVLIEGVPGSGKSTLVQRMCHDWSIGDFAQDFKVVVQVTLRNLPKDKKLSLEDLIYTSIASQKAVSEISDFISDHDGQHVLFIFDGFDEVSEQMRKRSIVRDVLAGRLAPLSSFIITTRPISAESLYSCVDRRIEITGFGDQEIHTFVTGYFSSFNPAAGKKLLSALSTRPSIKRLCYVPLLLLLICYSVSLGGEAAELPRTLHNLFENLIYLTINHNLERAEREERIGNLQDLSRLCRGFDELTSLALEGIERDTMVFSDLNFEVDDALHGLFNCIESRNHLGVISRTWHFLHLTLQEFMAALAVAKMTPEDQFSFWKERLLLKFDKKGMFIVAADRYLTMFTLFCGITGLQNRGIQNLLLDVVGDLWKPEIRYGTPLEKICRVIAESGNQALAIRLLSPFRRIVVQVNARLDLPSVTWCIMASKESVEELIAIDSFDRFGAMDSFDYFGVPLSTLAHFLGQLDQLSCLSAMEMPRIVCERSSSSSDKDVLTLSEFCKKQQQLKQLKLSLNGSVLLCRGLVPPKTDEVLLFTLTLSHQFVVQLLGQLPALRALILDHMKLSDVQDKVENPSVVSALSNAVKRHPNLTEVTVRWGSSHSAILGIVKGLMRKVDMRKLDMMDSTVPCDELVPYIMPAMKARALKVFTVTLYTNASLEELLVELPQTKLEELGCCLSFCKPPSDNLLEAAKVGLSECKTLKKLRMRKLGSSLTKTVLTSISSSLEEVELKYCHFGDGAMIRFADHLKGTHLCKVILRDAYCVNAKDLAVLMVEGLGKNESLEELVIHSGALHDKDVEDKDCLKSVKAAVSGNKSIKRMKIECWALQWTKVATAILEGAADNKHLRELEMKLSPRSHPSQEIINEVRRKNRKLQLIVKIGAADSHYL